jgi:Surface lipoprotein assembly modifier
MARGTKMNRRFGWSMSLMLIFCSFVNGSSYGQFSVAGSLSTMYDDNVNNDYSQVADRIGLLSLDLEHSWESEREEFGINYVGSLNYFSEAVERTFTYHSAGLSYERFLDDEGASKLSLGTSYSLRFDRGQYTFYDHGQFSMSGSLLQSFAERFRGQFSYAFKSLQFSDLPDFNYTEHYGAVRLTTFLPSKTTIIVDGSLGVKTYATSNEPAAPTGQMQGRGKREGDPSAPGITQMKGFVRIGQSIVEGTGLSFAAAYQVNLDKESRYLSSDYGAVSDDELFDDHYAYEGFSSNLMLTQILFQNMTLRLSIDQQHRNYSGRAAYDLNGSLIADNRTDIRRSLAFQAEYEFTSSGFSLAVAFDYIRNDSNDMFYQYTNNAFTMALRVPF